jgi:NitT/TauT family transport system substrate-binding protein
MCRKSASIGLAIVLFLTLPDFSTAQTARTRLRVAVSTATPHNTPLWVARDKKIFDKYGLDTELVFVSGGALVAQMLAAGEIDVAAGAPAALVNLIAAGQQIVAFLGLSNTSPFTLVTQSTIKTAGDLKGKRVGTARFGGSSHVSALIALEHLGLSLQGDHIILLQTGLDPERVAALEAKGLDGAMLQRVATKVMIGRGYNPLLNLSRAKIPYQNTVLAARRDFVTRRPQIGENFTRAVLEGYAYTFNKDNKSAVKEILAKNLRLAKPDDAEDFYLEAQEELDRKPYPTVEGTKTVIKYMAQQNPKVASVRAEETIDTSWLKKLDNEGFFVKIYGGK